MATWSCDQKVCATCRHWCGSRDVDFMVCFFDAVDTKGKCDGPSRNVRGKDTLESDSCRDWEFYRRD